MPTYDNSGNMVNDGAGRLCEFDSENRLMSATMGSTSSVEYDYDPFGRRVLKFVEEGCANLEERYVYDGPHCIAETDLSGAIQRKFIYGPGIDEALMMINVSGQTQTKYYYHRDALGNVMALSEGTGFIVEGYTYSAYGIAIVNTTPGTDGDWLTPDGTTSSTSAKGNPYMFTGRNYDWETGLYYYRARYYDATLGRFISADPIRYYGGMNLYAYVENNPINRTDPTGNSWWSVIPIVGTIINALADPEGQETKDYVSCMPSPTDWVKPCKDGADEFNQAVQENCKRCIKNKANSFMKDYVGIEIAGGGVELTITAIAGTIAAKNGIRAAIGSTLTAGILGIDTVIDAGITIDNVIDIYSAAADAADWFCRKPK